MGEIEGLRGPRVLRLPLLKLEALLEKEGLIGPGEAIASVEVDEEMGLSITVTG